MVMRFARIWCSGMAGGLFCGLIFALTPALVQAQSVSGTADTVEQRMEAGAAALDAAASSVEEPAPASEPPPTILPLDTAPSINIQPMPDTSATAPAGVNGEAVPADAPPAETAEAPAPAAESTVTEAETAPAPPTYTVQRGDSLWSISGGQLSDPFFWPKLWNVNPSVANPDLIYPGNMLLLPGQPPAAVVEAEPAEAPQEAEAPAMTDAELMEEPAQEEATQEAAQEATQEAQIFAEETPALFEEKVPSFEVLAPPPTQSKEILARAGGFVARDVPMAGQVVGNHEFRILLGEHDRIYLRSQGGPLEEQGHYTIYRRGPRVTHPVSRRVVGDLIQILGEVQVERADAVSTGMIVKFYATIEPGDLIMPTRAMEAAPMAPVVERTGEALSGVVLAVMEERSLTGQFDIVYIDQGESSGVIAGDHFQIFRHGDRTPAYAAVANVQLPDRLVGELEVLSVQADTATALLTRSTEVVQRGDRIER
jgi:LysM repeat protein